MGLGKFKNGRYWPITPYKGSWAEQEELRKKKIAPIVEEYREAVAQLSKKQELLRTATQEWDKGMLRVDVMEVKQRVEDLLKQIRGTQ